MNLRGAWARRSNCWSNPSPGECLQVLVGDRADIAFLALDPQRAQQAHFSGPYVHIEASYMVRSDSEVRDQSKVDLPGMEVLVIASSAYDLHLTRSLRHAKLVRLTGSEAVLRALLEDRSGRRVAAGIRVALMEDAERVSGLRLLTGRFMAIEHALVTPHTRCASACAAIDRFVAELVESGFIANSLSRHGIRGAAVSV